ncbi:hypothetical protein CIG23_27040 [Raoultella planticola]|uniref:hypothetical protein n=1 Tax=Raoultella planticola TaxID=575 RepID=UPI000BA12D0B|nr:hypothetical protein [Raoultella planticola]OZP70813.1 hypothetical protein CIG23_27040 [Raoultella planticola]
MSFEKFTSDNAAMLLIDHQVGTMGWAKSMAFDELKRNALMLATRLMLMNAGHTFQHEERILGEKGESMQCLQIFIRPSETNLTPQVQFHDFGTPYSDNNWRLIAGPENAPLTFRSQTWVQDARLAEGSELTLPAVPVSSAVRLLYVFEGAARVGEIALNTGESMIIEDGDVHTVIALDTTDLVLFTTDPAAKVFRGGMFSGNMRPHR